MPKLKFLYWGLYLALCFTSVWFVSGVVDNFLSKKTSFSQTEGYSYERPVITIALTGTGSGNLKYKDDLKIKYCPSYRIDNYDNSNCSVLQAEQNNSFSVIEKTEIVYLETNENFAYFRIIPQTP